MLLNGPIRVAMVHVSRPPLGVRARNNKPAKGVSALKHHLECLCAQGMGGQTHAVGNLRYRRHRETWESGNQLKYQPSYIHAIDGMLGPRAMPRHCALYELCISSIKAP